MFFILHAVKAQSKSRGRKSRFMADCTRYTGIVYSVWAIAAVIVTVAIVMLS